MNHSIVFSFMAASALCAVAACSGTAPSGVANAPAAGVGAQAQLVSACDRKLIAAPDVAGLLDQPITEIKNIPGDPQSCTFGTAGFSSVTVSVRPGHGTATIGMYTSGKMDEYDKSAPVAGVGDAAVRSLGLNRITARKGDLLCEITGPGMARAADDPMTLKLVALCNKIFAAY
jgi:hypothetical protein